MMTRLAFRILLRLYPREHRIIFAAEMLDVFSQTAAESKARGWRMYAYFIVSESGGLLRGAWNERNDNLNLKPVLGGTALAALSQAAFYWWSISGAAR
jgi:hypothetical protein